MRSIVVVGEREPGHEHCVISVSRDTEVSTAGTVVWSAGINIVSVNPHEWIVAPNNVPVVVENVLPGLVVILAVHPFHVCWRGVPVEVLESVFGVIAVRGKGKISTG